MPKKDSEKIMDRFIPSTTCQRNYRVTPSDSELDYISPERLIGRGRVRDDSILILSHSSEQEGSRALSSHSSRYLGPVFRDSEHKNAIAEALSFKNECRVFNFSPSKSNGMSLGSSAGSISNPSPMFSVMSADDSLLTSISSIGTEISKSPTNSPRKSKRIKSQIPFRVLDAPNLRNDFYTNLISWSKSTYKIAVGLGYNVYLRSEEDGVKLLNLPEDEGISCVSFSNGDFILVATKNGRIALFSQESLALIDQRFVIGHGICTITWFPDSETRFVVGDEGGDVHIFQIELNGAITLINKFKCHQQQVCGIAISQDGKQLAVGGNDNCCTIWDIENVCGPKLRYLLPHQAAVKAIAYCPWSKSLLATGGGSKDRTIRFWHTNSGTLISSIKTNGQITSLIWSKTKKQIVATFGYGDGPKPTLIAVYSYPKMEPLVQVEATSSIRVLSAVLSPDSGSVCVAANDETIRFYDIWDPVEGAIMESQENGVLGSDLIELCEGISKHGDSIR